MNDYLQNFLTRLKEVYGRLETRQKIVLASLLILTIAIFIWLMLWSSQVEYGLLYGNMEPEEAAEVIEKLDEMKIKYKLENAGRTILIPQESVYQTRIKLSSEGIASSRETGFEIFDKSTLGLTEFVQNINFRRAMEGELKRTIESINGIEYARVHLVFPEEKIFKEDQQDPSASVVLKLKKRLNDKQVQGISNLISSAVEGLDQSRVTILDQDGNVLTENFNDTVAGLSSFQMKIQQQIETSLANKAQTMLDNIVGMGNSVVRVTAELNFDNIETTLESYDPESKVIRSEEIESNSSDNESDSISSSSEHLISNYEINRTVQHIVNQVGNIKRLTIAVNLNHRLTIREEDGEEIKEYSERDVNEISQISSLVQNAVGYNNDRGDQIVVNSIKFDDTQIELARLEQERMMQRQEYIELAEKAIVLIILAALIFVMISQFRKIFAKPIEEEEEIIRPALAEGVAEEEGFYPEGEEGMPMGDGKISYSFKPMKDIEIEQSETQRLHKAVSKFIEDNPEVAVRLIKSWLFEKK